MSKCLKDKKFFLQFLPISLLEISEKKTIQYKNKNLKSSYIIDIIHNLILKYHFKKENSFKLNSLVLKDRYGCHYNYYMNYLIENGFIILERNYKKGKNSKVYKLSNSLIESKFKRYKNWDRVLLKKYINRYSKIENYNKGIPNWIKEKLINDLYKIEIDYERSLFYLNNVKFETTVYERNLYSVESIKNGHIFYHFDTYGRMHTNFTILKGFIRKNCLLIGGEETCEIDIPNSQPLLLSILMRDSVGVDREEFKLFKMLVETGNFYQYILDNWGEDLEKSQIKNIVYKVLFGKNPNNSKVDKKFSQIFPTVHKFIKKYKSDLGNYKSLSWKLQGMESNLIFNVIISKIISLNPEIEIVTIHDSIIVKKKWRELVQGVFNDSLKEMIGGIEENQIVLELEEI
jgi:hypothetical protein